MSTSARGFLIEPISTKEKLLIFELQAVVRRWPKMRGEPKAVWPLLYQMTHCGREQIDVTPSMIAFEQGCSDSKSGTRTLESFLREGLIERHGDVDNGHWLISTPDPRAVALMRKRRGDPQFLLFEVDEPPLVESDDTSAEDDAQPAVQLHQPQQRGKRGQQQPAARPAISFADEANPPCPDQSSERQKISGQLVEVVKQWANHDVSNMRKTLDMTAFIMKVVNDPDLDQSIVLRFAQAIVDGYIPRKNVTEALAYLNVRWRKGLITKTTRGGYWMGMMKVRFRKFNLEWKRPE